MSLSTRRGPAGRDAITYADLGVEQLGAVYERVLDLPPTTSATRHSPERRPATGHSDRRKRSGTFYTPRALTEFVVRRTLRPLAAGASSDRILSLRVLDPAMGSGAFLVAACRYLATAYERALIEEGRLAEQRRRRRRSRRPPARRRPAVPLRRRRERRRRSARAPVALARDAGARQALGFLDHRLRVGNSLIGASFDDLRHVRDARGARVADLPLFDAELESATAGAVSPLHALADRADDAIEDVRAKEVLWARASGDGGPLAGWRRAADLWCARWFWPDRATPSAAELRAAIDAWTRHDRTLPPARLAALGECARTVARQHGFFHWPIELADVFYDAHGRARPDAGFDAVVGNPPWEMLRNDRALGDGPSAPHAEKGSGPDGPHDERRTSNRELVKFIRQCGHYPSCDRGHVNLYQPFLSVPCRSHAPAAASGSCSRGDWRPTMAPRA